MIRASQLLATLTAAALLLAATPASARTLWTCTVPDAGTGVPWTFRIVIEQNEAGSEILLANDGSPFAVPLDKRDEDGKTLFIASGGAQRLEITADGTLTATLPASGGQRAFPGRCQKEAAQ